MKETVLYGERQTVICSRQRDYNATGVRVCDNAITLDRLLAPKPEAI